MSTEPATQRARTTCDDCGLPYYADENDACPYCDTSSAATETDPQRDRGSEPTPPDRRRRSASRPGSKSLLQRLTNALKDAFRR
ncbi:hypothetical protein [Halopiger aswanensis]|uniref:Uncharacterized protein n=1 Tax=Halopiger aswanensis TaxID=148449 RepID=A0A3R7GXF5_9EURY|nr:hypothetical protein [Halopiger aswanensis]RKD97271.1 hypothetical protein ATJ93_0256 [Halopiger aswanensis]